MPTPNPSIEPHPQASFACLRMRLMSNVEAVGKPLLKNIRISMKNLASQNLVYATILRSGMVNVSPYFPHSLRRGLFLQPR